MRYDLNVLIVDDEESFLVVFDMHLEPNVKRVFHANSCEEAIELLDKHQVDVVFSDVRMPERNGVDLVREIKAKYPSIVCIMVTGYADKDLAIESMRIGVYDIIEKPFNEITLAAALERANAKVMVEREQKAMIDKFLKSKLSKSDVELEDLEASEIEKMKEVAKHIVDLKKLNKAKVEN